VCRFDSWPAEHLMQQIAQENNLSETAFIVPSSNDESDFNIRWFTPHHEVDLCGHATMAAAHAIFTDTNPPLQNIVRFSTEKRGHLEVEKKPNHTYTLNFPALELQTLTYTPELLVKNLSIAPAIILAGLDYFLIYDNEQQVKSLTINSNELKALNRRGIIATAPGQISSQFDCVSRCFYPSHLDAAEDPVTGSAHTMITPYWAKQLGKNRITALQASKRSGVLQCEIKNDRVYMTGQAITYLKGKLELNSLN
jgi:PhzF family phenazine biosynthesis protein